MIIEEPRKIKLELMSNEIENIRDELESSPHNIFLYMNYENLIKKLNKSLEEKSV